MDDSCTRPITDYDRPKFLFAENATVIWEFFRETIEPCLPRDVLKSPRLASGEGGVKVGRVLKLLKGVFLSLLNPTVIPGLVVGKGVSFARPSVRGSFNRHLIKGVDSPIIKLAPQIIPDCLQRGIINPVLHFGGIPPCIIKLFVGTGRLKEKGLRRAKPIGLSHFEVALPGNAIDGVDRIPKGNVPVIVPDKFIPGASDRPCELFIIVPVGFGKDGRSMGMIWLAKSFEKTYPGHGGLADIRDIEKGRG